MSEVKKNFLYNISYQILTLIIPLITIPYISKVLGAEGVGIWSYTYSIVSIFSFFILLGINNYGNRTIAKYKNNKIEISKAFLSIYAIQIVMAVITISIYFLYIVFINNKYEDIAIIQLIYLFRYCYRYKLVLFWNRKI